MPTQVGSGGDPFSVLCRRWRTHPFPSPRFKKSSFALRFLYSCDDRVEARGGLFFNS